MGLIDVVEHDFVLVSDEGEFVLHVTADDITEVSLLEVPSHEVTEDLLLSGKDVTVHLTVDDEHFL